MTRPTPFVAGEMPILEGSDKQFLREQLLKLERSITSLIDMSPQTATQTPQRARDGMIRLARAPWRPVPGQTADAWVYFDGTDATWKYL